MLLHNAQLHHKHLRPYVSRILVKISEYMQETETPDFLFYQLPGMNVPMQY